MYHKSIPARRFERRQHIARKRYIQRSIYGISPEILAKEPIGKLAKNKVHCSCPLCACKSTTDNGVRTNSKRNYSIADKRRLARIDSAMHEYNIGVEIEMDAA